MRRLRVIVGLGGRGVVARTISSVRVIRGLVCVHSFKARAGDDSVGVGFRDMWRAVQRESVRDSLFESGGLFFGIPFAVVVHVIVWVKDSG